MKNKLWLLLFVSLTLNTYAQNNMEWINMEALPANLTACTAPSQSCCGNDESIICYALVFTPTFVDALTGNMSPADSLVFTSYTTFFRIDCAPDNEHSIVYNESCIMNDNSTTTQFCPTIEQRFNSSGNSGFVYVKPGESYIIHQVCVQVEPGEIVELEIREPPAHNVQSNCSLGSGQNAITENLDVDNLMVEMDDCILQSPSTDLEIDNGSLYIDNMNGVIMKSPNGDCFLFSVKNNGDLMSKKVNCP